MKWRNPVELDQNRFDCEIDHPSFRASHGWIPCTVSADDDATRAIHADITAALAGNPNATEGGAD